VLSFLADCSYGGAAPALNHESPDDPGTGFDIVLLMDSSESMIKTDPENYRKQAARLLAFLFGKNDRIGIVGFADSARLLLPLTENVPAEEKDIVSGINRIS
jgi:Mg-chelatase subunit ChlD